MAALVAKLRPLLASLLLTAPVAAAVVWAIEAFYGVPLDEKSFRFERPDALWLVAAAPLALIVRGFLRRKRAPRLRVSRGFELRAAPQGLRAWLPALHTALRVVALLLLALALMGPQSIHARDATEVEGIDIVVALDLSLSMQAADIKPNRFEATKQVVGDFIRRRPNDRIGSVIFGRDAYTLLPLTTDHEALRTMVAELQLGMIEGRGTAIGNAIGVAINRLRRSQAKSKVVILATDGDSNSGNVSPTQAADFASALGVKVYTILMGQSGDAPVQTGLDLFGRPLFDRGNFPVNPELLREVATQTGGEAFEVSDREGLEKSFHKILDALEKSQIEDAGRVYGELFAVFLAPALLLLLLELLLGVLVLRRWP
ncbi:MAG: VWA domain-containing protein [Myxococcales bacterium]|nr:VWA domain-containing protein [Myxococcales bacterium]